MELGLVSLAVALGVGLPLGVLAAVKRNSWIDYVCSSVAMVGICVPTFVLGPLLILVFAIHFGQFNASGWFGPMDWVLPSITLGSVYAAYVARLTRGGMLEVLSQDYIRTARAKGASETRVVLKHALRGGLTPVVSFLGPAIAGIVTGSFVIETIFQIPGIGREFINSATNRDYTLVLDVYKRQPLPWRCGFLRFPRRCREFRRFPRTTGSSRCARQESPGAWRRGVPSRWRCDRQTHG